MLRFYFYRRQIKTDSQMILYNEVYSNIIHNKQKLETSQLSTIGEWIDWYIHTMEQYSDIKKNDFLNSDGSIKYFGENKK